MVGLRSWVSIGPPQGVAFDQDQSRRAAPSVPVPSRRSRMAARGRPGVSLRGIPEARHACLARSRSRPSGRPRLIRGRAQLPDTFAPPSRTDNSAQRQSPSYRLAALDTDFLLGGSMRGARFMLEFAKTDEILRAFGVSSTIVVFG